MEFNEQKQLKGKIRLLKPILWCGKAIGTIANIAVPAGAILGGMILVNQDHVLFGLCAWSTSFWWISDWLNFDKRTENLIKRLRGN